MMPLPCRSSGIERGPETGFLSGCESDCNTRTVSAILALKTVPFAEAVWSSKIALVKHEPAIKALEFLV